MSIDKVVDSLSVAEERSTLKRRSQDFRIIGFNYTLNIDDGNGGHLEIFSRENWRVGEMIIDNIKTGKKGEILRKEAIFDESKRAK